MRDKKLLLNTIMPIGLEIVTVVSGFVIPRAILIHFGSEVNGLVQSITQFLAVISFLEMGVGSVVRYNLYKPLATNDYDQISRVVVAANRFFRGIALVLLAYTGILIIVFPSINNSSFDWMYTALLIAAMCISSFAQFYFGQVNQLLLTADQKGYIQYGAQIVTVIANTIASVVLINLGTGIQIVKLVTSLIFLLRPIYLQWHVNKHYNINYNIKYEAEPISQKWNGIAQHISSVVLDNTDVIVLTVLSSFENVSIYSVYYMIVNGIKLLMTTAVSGIQSKLGDILVRENNEELKRTFSVSEWAIHTAGTFLFGCTITLIVPFVMVYTKGVNDANYYVPVFAALITLANACHTYRLPYSILILSAGHYKQTQWNYIFASSMNIIVSVILVYFCGLIGVAIGTMAAMSFQTIWMAYYCYKNLLSQPIKAFWKQLFIDVFTITLVFILSKIISIQVNTYIQWIGLALIIAGISIIIILAINFLFYRKMILSIIHRAGCSNKKK